MVGAFYLLPLEEVFVYPFTDYLALLFQSPLIFNYWDRENDESPLFSTLRDTEYLDREVRGRGRERIEWSRDHMYPLTSRIGLTIHDFSDTSVLEKLARPASYDAHGNDISRLFSGLMPTSGEPTIDEMLSLLERSLFHHRSRLANHCQQIEALPLDHDRDVREKLDPFLSALQEILRDPLQSCNLTVDSPAGFKLPNLFPVFRTVYSTERRLGHFDYHAAIRFLPETARKIRGWFHSSIDARVGDVTPATDPVAALESPTGLTSRTIADLVFSSGVVDFGRKPSEGNWDVGADIGDRERQQLECLIYPKRKKLFYVPIHGGGAPWMCLFTFSPEGSDGWFHNYTVYRDVIQSVAPQIRAKAEEVYIDHLAESVITVFRTSVSRSSIDLCTAINSSLQKLAQVFPFPLVRFRPSDVSPQEPNEIEEEHIYVPGRGAFAISFSSNCFFSSQVNWCLGNSEKIRAMLRKAVRDFTSLEKDIELTTVARASHLFKTPLNRISDIIESASAQLPVSDVRHLALEVAQLYQLSEFTSALMSSDKHSLLDAKYRSEVSAHECADYVHGLVANALSIECDPRLQSPKAERMRSLQGDGCFQIERRGTFAHDSVVVFKPLVSAVVDGLVSNAVKYLSRNDPLLSLAVVCDEHSCYLEVKNNSTLPLAELEQIAIRLNSPSPDLVGVSLLHWISRVCWQDYQDERKSERLVWQASDEAGVCLLVATAKIGAIKCVKLPSC